MKVALTEIQSVELSRLDRVLRNALDIQHVGEFVIFFKNWLDTCSIDITQEREDATRYVFKQGENAVVEIQVESYANLQVAVFWTDDTALPFVRFVFTWLQMRWGAAYPKSLVEPDAWEDDGETGQNNAPEERSMKLGTAERVREMHRLLKGGKSQRQAKKEARCDPSTYHQWCLTVTGEDPILPYR